MFRKTDIKILATVFGVLLALVIIVSVIDANNGSRTFKNKLADIDAEQVSSIEIIPKANNFIPIKLVKEGNNWIVESESEKYNADQSLAGELIAKLNNLKPKSVVATDKNRWKKYEVTDTLGTRVKVYNGSNLLADVVLGKFSYAQPRSMTTYVRLASEDEVYGVDGMLGMLFNRKVNSFRDKTVIKSNKTDWTKLTFTYPADSSFVLEKKAGKWMIGNTVTDSAAVANYFNKIARLNNSSFTNKKPKTPVTHRLTIEGNNQMNLVEITGYYIDDKNFIIETNQNKGALFNDKELAGKIFISSGNLIKK